MKEKPINQKRDRTFSMQPWLLPEETTNTIADYYQFRYFTCQIVNFAVYFSLCGRMLGIAKKNKIAVIKKCDSLDFLRKTIQRIYLEWFRATVVNSYNLQGFPRYIGWFPQEMTALICQKSTSTVYLFLAAFKVNNSWF